MNNESIYKAIERLSYDMNNTCSRCFEDKDECDNCYERNYYNTLIKSCEKQIRRSPKREEKEGADGIKLICSVCPSCGKIIPFDNYAIGVCNCGQLLKIGEYK